MYDAPHQALRKGLDYGNASYARETRAMTGTSHPQQNHILDALPQPERDRLFPHLKLVALPLGEVLYESGDTLRHIYFPTDSIISLLYVLEDGGSAEIAVVGNEARSAWRSSWAVKPRPTVPSYKAPALHTD